MAKGRWALNERFLIGRQENPMMERWRLFSTPWFGLYVHFIYREDLDRDPHDHPWQFWSLVLRGGYTEQVWHRPSVDDSHLVDHKAGSRHHFPLRRSHQIVKVRPGTVTLVLVGPKSKEWGFWEEAEPGRFLGTRRWLPWDEYARKVGLPQNSVDKQPKVEEAGF